MLFNRNFSLILETAGLASFIAAAAFFDATFAHNDFPVVGLFLGLILFGLAGMFFQDDSAPITEIFPFALGVLGFVLIVAGAFAAAASIDAARCFVLFGVFAVISAVTFFKVKA